MSVLNGPYPAVGREFRIGRVLSRTFQVLRRQAIPFALLRIATMVPPCLMQLFALRHSGRGPLIANGAGHFGVSAEWFAMLLLLIGSFALVPLGSAMILLATIKDLEGERPLLDPVARQAGARFVPLLGCLFCGWLAVAGGCMLLIVPGVIAALVLCVAGQVCVAERLGPIESFSRSADLTRGNRWRILGVYLVVVSMICALSLADGLAESSLGAVGVLAGIGIVGFSEALWATACAVLYIDLRLCRDGVGTQRIAAVFD